MKNWCLENPWMTFILAIFLINGISDIVRYICIAIIGAPIPRL